MLSDVFGTTLLDDLRADAPAAELADLSVDSDDLEVQTEVLHTTQFVEEAAPVNRGTESDGTEMTGFVNPSSAVMLTVVCGAALVLLAGAYALAVSRSHNDLAASKDSTKQGETV